MDHKNDVREAPFDIATLPSLPSAQPEKTDESTLPTASDSEKQSVDETSTEVLSVKQERIYIAALCWAMIICGWTDGTIGPLLPRIQEVYHLSYTTVSMLFVSGCIGCILGSFNMIYMTDHLGFGKIMGLTGCSLASAFAVLSVAPPFPVMCIAYLVTGWSNALQAGQAMTFLSSIPRNTTVNMGIVQACYGLGAFCSPFVATQFAQQPRWSFHFLVSVGVALTNLTVMVSVFKLKSQDYFLPPPDIAPLSAGTNKYKQIFSQQLVHFMSFFILLYVGVEVSIGGWIVTYLIRHRGGGPSSGYVSSGFFGGMMVGRLVLLPVTEKVGRKRVVYIYSSLVIALQFTIWFVPNLLENAIAVSFVGVFLGPIYPTSINVAAELLPSYLHAGAIGWIGAFGQVGSALFPFITGAIANKYGVQVLQPVTVALMFTQTALWYFVTHSKVPRVE